MNFNFPTAIKGFFVLGVLAAFTPAVALADSILSDAREDAPSTSRAMVFCAPNTEVCDARTAGADFRGAADFSGILPPHGAGAPAFTLPKESALGTFREDGRPRYMVIVEPDRDEKGRHRGLAFDREDPVAVPEPSALELLGLGMVGLAWGAMRRRTRTRATLAT